jgi:hypothetical protein
LTVPIPTPVLTLLNSHQILPPPLLSSYLSFSDPDSTSAFSASSSFSSSTSSSSYTPKPPPYPQPVDFTPSAILPDIDSELDRLLHLSFASSYYGLPTIPPLPSLSLKQLSKHAPTLLQISLNLTHSRLHELTNLLNFSRDKNVCLWGRHFTNIKRAYIADVKHSTAAHFKGKAVPHPSRYTHADALKNLPPAIKLNSSFNLNSSQRSSLHDLYQPPPLCPRSYDATPIASTASAEEVDSPIDMACYRIDILNGLLECSVYNQTPRRRNVRLPSSSPKVSSPDGFDEVNVARSQKRQIDRHKFILSSLSLSLNQISDVYQYYFDFVLDSLENSNTGSNIKCVVYGDGGRGWEERGVTELLRPVHGVETPSLYLGTVYDKPSEYDYTRVYTNSFLSSQFTTFHRSCLVTMLTYGEVSRRLDEILNNTPSTTPTPTHKKRNTPLLLPPNLYAALSSTAHIMNTHLYSENYSPSAPLTYRGELVAELIRALGVSMACGWNDGTYGNAVTVPGDVPHANHVYNLKPGLLVGGIIDVLVNGTRWREFEHAEDLPEAEFELREAVEFTFLRTDLSPDIFEHNSYFDSTEIEMLGISDRLVNGGHKGDYGTLPGAVIEALIDSRMPGAGIEYFDHVYSDANAIAAAPACCVEAAIVACSMAQYQVKVDLGEESAVLNPKYRTRALSLYESMHTPTARATSAVVKTLQYAKDYQGAVNVLESSALCGETKSSALLFNSNYLSTKDRAVAAAVSACNEAHQFERAVQIALKCCPVGSPDYACLTSSDSALAAIIDALRGSNRSSEAVALYNLAMDAHDSMIPTKRGTDVSTWVHSANAVIKAMKHAKDVDNNNMWEEANNIVQNRLGDGVVNEETMVALAQCGDGRQTMKSFVEAENRKLVTDELRGVVMISALGETNRGAESGWDKIVRFAKEFKNVMKHKNVHEYAGADWLNYYRPCDPVSLEVLFKAFHHMYREDMTLRLIAACSEFYPHMLSAKAFANAFDTIGRNYRHPKCRGEPLEEYWAEKHGSDEDYNQLQDAMLLAGNQVGKIFAMAEKVGLGTDKAVVEGAIRAFRALRRDVEIERLLTDLVVSGEKPPAFLISHGINSARENKNTGLEKKLIKLLQDCGYNWTEETKEEIAEKARAKAAVKAAADQKKYAAEAAAEKRRANAINANAARDRERRSGAAAGGSGGGGSGGGGGGRGVGKHAPSSRKKGQYAGPNYDPDKAERRRSENGDGGGAGGRRERR